MSTTIHETYAAPHQPQQTPNHNFVPLDIELLHHLEIASLTSLADNVIRGQNTSSGYQRFISFCAEKGSRSR